MRPKARWLTQHGGPHGWLKESDPAGCDFVSDGRSMPPALTDHLARSGADLLLNVHKTPSWGHARKAWYSCNVHTYSLVVNYTKKTLSDPPNLTLCKQCTVSTPFFLQLLTMQVVPVWSCGRVSILLRQIIYFKNCFNVWKEMGETTGSLDQNKKYYISFSIRSVLIISMKLYTSYFN